PSQPGLCRPPTVTGATPHTPRATSTPLVTGAPVSNRYAARTDVTSDRSRAEIERTLTRYGATAFSYGWQEGLAAIQFVRNGRRIRFVLPLPDRNDREFTHHSRGPRTPAAAEAAWEQASRQRWRMLALVV